MSWAQIAEWAQDALRRVLEGAVGALSRSQNIAEQLRTLPTDVLIAIAAYCSLLALVALAGWSHAAARRRRAARALADSERDRAELQAKYNAEVKWRTAAERVRDEPSGGKS